MNIELSAVKAWRAANKETAATNELQRSAMKKVVLPLAEKLLQGQDTDYLHEIGQIIDRTEGNEAARDAQLHQIMGIAEQQGILVYEQVEEQISNIVTGRKLAL